MTNATPSGNSPQTQADKTSRPSVPISVYRELAAELQETKIRLESIHQENQLLTQQNELLRQEIEQIITSHLHLEEVINSLPSPGQSQKQPKKTRPRRKVTPVVMADIPAPPPEIVEQMTPPVVEESKVDDSPSEKSFTEEIPSRSHRVQSASSRPSEVNIWLLLAAFVLIVSSAFAAGFLIVRPLLNNNNSR